VNVDLPWGVLPRSGEGGDCSGEIFGRSDHPGGVVCLVISILVGLLLQVVRGVSVDFHWHGRCWRR